MRKALAPLLGAAALALPGTNAWAAATAKTKVVTKTKTFTGALGSAQRWGYVEVKLVVKKTAKTNPRTKKTTVRRRITAVRVPIYPNHTDRSVFINQEALPILINETLAAQSARIQMVTGATYSSQAFEHSLQSAILKEKRW
jgi:uncharacterized protein with FMN-binding domain